MDPFYGYDNGGDPNPNDPNHYNSWANQWTAPAAAAAVQQQAAGGFPQYVSPQQQAAQQQAQQTYAAMNPNSMSNFMQQQQKSQQQQFQQNKFGQHGPIGAPKPAPPHHQLSAANATNPRSFGAFGGVGGGVGAGVGRGGGGGGIAQEWIAPASQQQGQFGMSNLRTFPSKTGGGGGAVGGAFGGMNKPNWRQQKAQRQAQQMPKKLETAGKTPAMVLHEVFKDVKEETTEVPESNPKRYCCTLTLQGQKFEMESPNKKTAKQKCAELAIRTLRPDLNVAPFGEGAAPKAAAPKPPAPAVTAQTGASTPTKRNAEDGASATQPPAKKKDTGGSAKKAKEPKLSPVEAAASLADLMMRLIAERGPDNKLTPVYEAVELPPAEGQEAQVEEPVVKQEAPAAAPEVVKEEPMEGAENKAEEGTETTSPKKKYRKDKDRVRRPEIQVQYTLKFTEIGKEYTKTGTNRGMLKDMVIREALSDYFNVSQEDIVRVARRFAMNRLTKEMNLVQCLLSTCSILNCSVQLLTEPAEDRPIGEGRAYYMGRCVVTDHSKDEAVFETKTDSLPSKALAKDHAAQEMLKQYFDIDPNTIKQEDAGNNNNNQQGPCSLLHAMMNKKTKQRTQIEYTFQENMPQVVPVKQHEQIFYCNCTIDGETFNGQGRSKKLAKNAAAVVALKKKFDIDFDPEKAYPLAHSVRPEQRVSQLCAEIAEYCKREYYHTTTQHQISQSNAIAAFVLINEKNEKRICSWASSSHPIIVEPDNLNGANGNHLIHFDPIVLARRALIRMLCVELQFLGGPDAAILELKEDGRYGLKSNLKLVLYANYSPGCAYSADDAAVKSLAMVTQLGLAPVPSETLDVHEIRKNKELRVHCTADKLYKWNMLGVQGGLLSNVMHPLYISHVFFGSQYNISDESLKFAFCNRLADCTLDRPEPSVESIPVQINLRGAAPHVWFRSQESVDVVCCNTGRTQNGMPSNFCKATIFEHYLAIPSVHQNGEVNYAKEKERAANYQYEKRVFYNKLEAAGLGKWQQKPSELVDDFTAIATEPAV